jgi:tetratricopeptide (TPR) repeat protein
LKLGKLYFNNGRYQDALRILTEVLRKTEASHDKQEIEAFSPLLLLSQVHEKMGNLDKAEDCCERGLKIVEALHRYNSAAGAIAMHQMGCIHILQKRYGMARFAFEEAKAIIQKQRKPSQVAEIRIAWDIARLDAAAGRAAESRELLRQTLQQTRDLIGEPKDAHGRALLANSIKRLVDVLEPGEPSTKQECETLKAELRSLLEQMKAHRTLDAENREWLNALNATAR